MNFSELIIYKNHFETSKREILHHWMSQTSAYETLESYNIAPEFFGRYFGGRFIDHAFGVVDGENELGSCPIVGVMLVFFQKKKFAIDDIFMLCAGLKNAFLSHSLKSEILTQKVMDEISHLMDQNLKGVVCEFNRAVQHEDAAPLACSIDYNTELLKYKAKATTSAYQYLQEIEIDFELLDELNEIETEAMASIHLDEAMTPEVYGKVIALLLNYIKVLNWLLEFKEIAFSLNILIDILQRTPIESIDKEHLGIAAIYLKAIVGDLSMWRESVFVTQSAQDIHYLDETLLSSIAQLQIMLSEDEQHDTCDIEFF